MNKKILYKLSDFFITTLIICLNPTIVLAASVPKPPSYLDHGTGSIIIKVIIAILDVVFIIKSYWSRILFSFKRIGKKEQNDASYTQEES